MITPHHAHPDANGNPATPARAWNMLPNNRPAERGRPRVLESGNRFGSVPADGWWAFRWVGWVCALAYLATGAAQAPPLRAAEPVTFRVISYNVQFLPGIAAVANKRKETPYRARTIGEKLREYDIIGFNEVFDDSARKLLLKQFQTAWGSAYQAVLAPKPDKNRFMGGVAIVTRFPLLDSHAWVYTVSSSPEKYGLGADGFAAKGVVHARIGRPGPPGQPPTDYVDIFSTHLEAREDELRPQQYKELADFVAQHSSPDHPVLILGDMNTRGEAEYQRDPNSTYHLMMNTYQAGRGAPPLVDVWLTHGQGHGGTTDQESSETGHRIDYLLLSNPTRQERLIVKSIHVNPFQDPRVGALSDHSAVEAQIEWRAPQ